MYVAFFCRFMAINCLIMSIKKIFILTICCLFTVGIAGCDLKDASGKDKKQIKTYTSFIGNTCQGISDNNRLQNVIAEKIGAKCDETWLESSENVSDIVDKMIIADDYPDFLYVASEHQKLLDAGAYIPIDEYWDDYDNIKNFFPEEKWNRIRSDDGHIYIIPVFSSVYMYDTDTIHDDEAFWIQVKVLQWAGYPEIQTLDDYFGVLEKYIEANPIAPDGTPNIAYEILTDGSMYFCLENPPQFLDGYPNDGCCIVDPITMEAKDYNTTATAKKWFKKLNEEYQKGIVDPNCFVMTKEQYYDTLAQGNVLGMVDQRWDFAGVVAGLPAECTYVPFGVVADKSIEEHYHSETALNYSEGIGISVSCDDIKGAMKFLNDLLDPEILTLRYWGQKDIDYCVDEEGKFYLNDEQTSNCADGQYLLDNMCNYSYFPHYKGMNQDEINAYSPEYQPYEFYKTLSPIMQECFSAYGVQTYVEMLNKSEESAPWFPMWSYSNTFTTETPHGQVKADMDEVKHEYLPRVIMSNDFEATWDEYMVAYNKRCDIKIYFDELTNEIRRRTQN